MIRRVLAPASGAALTEALLDARAELGVDVPPMDAQALLGLPDAPHVVRAEEGGTTWAVRRRAAWMLGQRVTFGELLPLATPLPGDAPAGREDEDAVLWSLTTAARWERLELELGFELVRTPLQLVARPQDVRAAHPRGIEVTETTGFPPEIEALAERVAASAEAMLVRDRATLEWRFRAERGHRIVLARRAGQLVGCAVFRQGMLDGVPDQGLVAEWLVPPEEHGAGNALRSALAAHAREHGIERLAAMVPDWSTDWLSFQRDGFHAVPTRYVLCARTRQRRHDAFWLFKRWYTTLADGGLV